MHNLQKNLTQQLDGAGKIAVLAVGSRLRGDDAAGLLTAAHLKRHLRRNLSVKAAAPRVSIFMGDTAPENFTGEIKQLRPSHLVILDAADSGRSPGNIELVDPNGLSSNLSAVTHGLPIKLVIDYIHHFAPCHVTIVGIQPETVHFGMQVSDAVRQATRNLARVLAQAINEL